MESLAHLSRSSSWSVYFLLSGGEGVLGLRGGLGQRVDDVVDLNLGLLRGGPHVRVVLEFWGLAVLPERPRARVHVLDALVDGVLAVAIAHAFALDARGYGHDAVEAGGVHGLVEEVLEVDSVDEHVVGLGERLHLLWGHLVLVGAGVRGEQTGEVEGHWASPEVVSAPWESTLWSLMPPTAIWVR